MTQRDVWSADTAISRPEPIDEGLPPLVDLGGFVMTAGGLAHGLTNADMEEIFTPIYAPEGFRG